MSGLNGQLGFQFTARVVEAFLLPIEEAQSEVGFGLFGRRLHGGFKLGDGLFGLVGGVHYLAHQHVYRRRVRILLQKDAELFAGVVILLGPQAALGQAEAQLLIVGVVRGGKFQMNRSGIEPAHAVVTHAQQGAGLKALRILFQSVFKGVGGFRQSIPLEIRDTEVQIDAGSFGSAAIAAR